MVIKAVPLLPNRRTNITHGFINYDRLLAVVIQSLMKKETFIEAIEAIASQIRFDIEVSKKLGEAFPNAHTANLLPDNHFVSNALMKVLQEEMNDNEVCKYGQSWIEWFCFETDFGNESYRLQAFDENKQPIKMDNAGDLYDFLNNR